MSFPGQSTVCLTLCRWPWPLHQVTLASCENISALGKQEVEAGVAPTLQDKSKSPGGPWSWTGAEPGLAGPSLVEREPQSPSTTPNRERP